LTLRTYLPTLSFCMLELIQGPNEHISCMMELFRSQEL